MEAARERLQVYQTLVNGYLKQLQAAVDKGDEAVVEDALLDLSDFEKTKLLKLMEDHHWEVIIEHVQEQHELCDSGCACRKCHDS